MVSQISATIPPQQLSAMACLHCLISVSYVTESVLNYFGDFRPSGHVAVSPIVLRLEMLILAKDGDTAAYIVQINTSNFFCHIQLYISFKFVKYTIKKYSELAELQPTGV